MDKGGSEKVGSAVETLESPRGRSFTFDEFPCVLKLGEFREIVLQNWQLSRLLETMLRVKKQPVLMISPEGKVYSFWLLLFILPCLMYVNHISCHAIFSLKFEIFQRKQTIM